MATVLDVGILRYFDVIFPFILVLSLIFAILHKKKFVSDNPSINATIAVVFAFLVILSDAAVQIINFMIPWLTVTIVFAVLLLLVFQVMGLKEEKLPEIIKDKAVYWVILAIGLLIMIAAFGSVFGQTLTEVATQGGAAVDAETGGSGTGDFQSNIYSIIFNSKVLGLMVLFTIAVFATFMLTGKPE